MSLVPFSVDLDTIIPPNPDRINQFQDGQIYKLASLFLQVRDTIKPIILRKVTPISFEILEGYFEYCAAMRAQEIDNQFTAIQAYIAPPKIEAAILEQYKFIGSLPIPNISSVLINSVEIPKQVNNDKVTGENTQNLTQIEEAIAIRLEQKLTAVIEKTIEDCINTSLQVIMGQVTKQLDAHLADFRQSLSLVPIHQVFDAKPQTIQAVSELETVKISKTDKATKSKTTTKSASKVTTKPKTESTKTAAKNKDIDNNDSKTAQVLNDFNTLNIADLESKLKQSAKGNIKFARPIHEQRSQQLFTSIDDVISRVKGLAEKTMQRIVSSW